MLITVYFPCIGLNRDLRQTKHINIGNNTIVLQIIT